MTHSLPLVCKKNTYFIDLFRKRVGRIILQTSGLEITFFTNEWVQNGTLGGHSFAERSLWGSCS